MVSVVDITSVAIDLFKQATNGQTPDRLKIQKILYYSQGYSLAILKKPLFEEDFIKCDFGPFIQSLTKYNDIIDNFKTYSFPKPSHNITIHEMEIIKQVIEMVKNIRSTHILQQTHREEPWMEVEHGAVITKHKIQQYFTSMSFKFYLHSIVINNSIDRASLNQLRCMMQKSYTSHKGHNLRELEELEAFILENASTMLDYKKLSSILFFPCELDYFGMGEPLSVLLSRKSVLLRLAYSSKYNNILGITYLIKACEQLLYLFDDGDDSEEEEESSTVIITTLTNLKTKLHTKLESIISCATMKELIVMNHFFKQVAIPEESKLDEEALLQRFLFIKSTLTNETIISKWEQLLQNIKSPHLIPFVKVEQVSLHYLCTTTNFDQMYSDWKELGYKYNIGYALVNAAALVCQGRVTKSNQEVLQLYVDAASYGFVSALRYALEMENNMQFVEQLALYGDIEGWRRLKENKRDWNHSDALYKYYILNDEKELNKFYQFIDKIIFANPDAKDLNYSQL